MSEGAAPSLRCQKVVISAGARVLAEEIDLELPPGAVHAVMGPSGCGKSTLLWTIAGMLPAQSGRVNVCGEDIRAQRPRAAAATRRRHMGIVYQQANLITELSVVQNVAIPLQMTRRLGKAEAESKARSVLSGLGIDIATDTAFLSGGEQQRVSVARATAGGPAVILADEPTAALDEESAALVMDSLLSECRARRSALLMVTHDSRVAARAHVVWRLTPDGMERLDINSRVAAG